MASVGVKYKTLRSILGRVRFGRSLFVCPRCGNQCFPADGELGVEHTAFTPGAQRMMAKAASRSTFAEAAEDLALYANLRVPPKTVERCAEAVGREIEAWMNRRIRPASSKPAPPDDARRPGPRGRYSTSNTTAPAYLSPGRTGGPQGQTTRRLRAAPARSSSDASSPRPPSTKKGVRFGSNTTTYVGAIESSEAFGKRVYAEALRRGLYHHTQVVLLTDGAHYNKSIAELHFSNAVHIIDLYHAFQHVHELATLLVPEKLRETTENRWSDLLDHGDIEQLSNGPANTCPQRAAGARGAHPQSTISKPTPNPCAMTLSRKRLLRRFRRH